MLNATTLSGTALIVEDLRVNRILLRRTLDAMHYQVTEAVTGLEAIHLISEIPFDVVFLDWELPGDLNGDHVARHLRSQPQGAATLLIAITGDTSEKMQERCAKAGTHAFLGKILDFKSVDTALSEARRRGPPSTRPDAGRIEQALGPYADVFPGGLSGAFKHCLEELIAEQDRLCAAAAEHCWPDAARAAHNLGAIGAMAGIPELHVAARAAENVLRTADQTAIPPAIEHTKLMVERACRALNDQTA
jgi:CheY-like chemotaxis protein